MVAAGLFVAAPVKAGDTSNTPVVDIRGAAMPPIMHTLHDCAWTMDGKCAIFVGTNQGMYGVAWWYDPSKTGNAAWLQATLVAGDPLATEFNAVIWNQERGYFMILGDTSSETWYHVSYPGENLAEEWDTDLDGCVEDLTFANGWGLICAAGNSGSTGPLYMFDNIGADWYEPTGCYAPDSNWLGCEYYDGAVYCCGSDGASGAMYSYYILPSGPWTVVVDSPSFQFTEMALDTFDYDRFVLTTKYRSASAAIWEASSGGSRMDQVDELADLPIHYNLYSIDIQADGFGVAVGVDTATGTALVYDIWWTGSTTAVMKRSDASATFVGQTFESVAIRPTGVQMAMIAGSAFKYSYTSVVGPIQVDTAVPHIDYLDIYPMGSGTGSSFINGQCDVDIGDSNTAYTLEARIYDNLGIGHLTSMDFWMWYDQGALATDVPGTMGPGFDMAGAENLRMHFRVTSANAVIPIYPAVTGTEETTLISGAWQVNDATSATVVVNFSPHQQVRYAPGDGSGTPFGEGVGDRYGSGPEGQSTVSALNAQYTWDIKVRVADDAPTTNYASAYDEFGFYKYTYLGAANIPNGGAVYGSGAPGTNDVVMTQSGSDVTFCANCPYGLQVTLGSALIGVAVPANTIAGTAITVRGGEVSSEAPFLAGGGTIALIGGPQAPRNSARVTTTSSYDEDPGTSEAIFWEVNIPGVPEDSYVSTITWSLLN
jgi:hypothetical protein